MSETARNKKLPSVFSRKLHRNIFTKCRRPFSNIDGNIENFTAYNANELGLSVRRGLPMKPANDPFHRKRLVVLDKFGGYPRVKITLTAVCFAEIAPLVAPYVRLDDFYTVYIRFNNIHN